MECDKRSPSVGCGKLLSVVEEEGIRSPVGREDRNRVSLLRARPDRLATITSVLWGKNALLLGQVIVALGPPIVGAALQLHQFLRWLVGPLLWRVEARPVLSQLVAAVLGSKELTRGVDCDAYRVAIPSN